MNKIILTILFTVFCSMGLNAKGMPSEYYEIKSIKKSKQYFFSYLFPLIEKENNKILKEREIIKSVFRNGILNIDYNSPYFLEIFKIQKKYKIDSPYSLSQYLQRVDIVPPSMALAQAAVESGWGKSRFIKEANNIFGHWTFNPEIGMLPENRDEGKKHFIRIFKNLQSSISAYMLNLNRNRAYRKFQNLRLEQREYNTNLDGLQLSQTMLNYSGIGKEYLKILKQVILTNKLLEYDRYFYK